MKKVIVLTILCLVQTNKSVVAQLETGEKKEWKEFSVRKGLAKFLFKDIARRASKSRLIWEEASQSRKDGVFIR
jgi:hypothetical protein